MRLYLSNYREKKDNTIYSNAVDIYSLDDLKKAVLRDHIAPAMQDSYRKNEHFLNADCIMLDLDNTHTEDPDGWKTLDDITDAFPGVQFYYIHSRNHMKEKTKTASNGTVTHYAPRAKYHCYFPLSKTYTNKDEYEAIMLKAAGLFPFFDLSAAKPAQFFFGVSNPTGGTEAGEKTLDQYVNEQPAEAVITAVKDFESKVASGEYSQEDETQNAISRLYNALGIKQQTPPAPAVPAEYLIQNSGEYTAFEMAIATAEQRQSLAWFEKWAGERGVTLGRRYMASPINHPNAVFICVICPWEDQHTMNGAENETVIIVDLGGRISFLCRHGHCAGRSWKDYRAYYDKKYAERQGGGQATTGAADQQTTGTTEEGKPGEPLPGLLTYSKAVNYFKTADDRYLELKSFPSFSATAKIKLHDSVVLAADTGAGKSSLALNFLNDLNGDYPCIYINLEMDIITVLRRLTAIYSGIELDRIEGYKHDEKTAAAVNVTLQAITNRKPLQVIQGAYMLQQIEEIIKRSIKGREEPTIVIIDHSLLVDTQDKTGGRYDRFTQVSEGLRRIALNNNIILFVLLQQNRAGKASEEERPRNSSLKESGSWENDATQICFLWYDPTDRRKKLLLTKNRSGGSGEFPLNYWQKTQTYTEATGGTAATPATGGAMQPRQSKRERQERKLQDAYTTAYFNTQGKPTLQAIAEAADVRTSTIKTWMKEYGGFMVDGQPIDPAGMDAIVEQQAFIKLTPANETPFDEPETAGNGQPITARF